MHHHFDPDAAATQGSGIFGLPHNLQDASIILLPVPFEATTSFRPGTADGPEAIRLASMQVDLTDLQFGAVYEAGIFMKQEPDHVRQWSDQARRLAEPIILAGGARPDDHAAVRAVDEFGAKVRALVHAETHATLDSGKIPGLVGGDHSTPLGAIEACAEHLARSGRPLGILQVDAHMDLREAFEGFAYSHASIMFNVLRHAPNVSSLVQVGLRDVGRGEVELARSTPSRLHPHYDLDWHRALLNGRPLRDLLAEAIAPLPRDLYISVDIDGLDPSLCPNTGTPVPGGLSFPQFCLLLGAIRDSGRRVVGFDLVEVAPGAGEHAESWDAAVGARALYKLCGLAWSTRGM